MITKLDFVAIPSTDSERSRRFYVETLGLRPDEHGQFECWAGDTCLGIWEPVRLGMEFAPSKNGHLALHVDDVDARRTELEQKGVSFYGETLDTGVCKMALFTDPDGNDLMLHHRYAPPEAPPSGPRAGGWSRSGTSTAAAAGQASSTRRRCLAGGRSAGSRAVPTRRPRGIAVGPCGASARAIRPPRPAPRRTRWT